MSKKYVIAVSKTFKHRGLRRHRPNTKKFWHIYGFYEDWTFFCEQVSSIKAMHYKQHLYHKIKRVCPECLTIFIGLVKKVNAKVECPNCYEKF